MPGTDGSDLARETYELQLSIHREVGNQLGEACTLQALGELMAGRGYLEGARAAWDEARQVYWSLCHRRGEASMLHGAGMLALRQHRPYEAFPLVVDALRLHRREGHQLETGIAHGALARIAGCVGADALAIAHAGLAMLVFVQAEHRHYQRVQLLDLGGILLAARQPRGIACLLRARALAADPADPMNARIDACIARVAPSTMAAGEWKRALETAEGTADEVIADLMAKATLTLAAGTLDLEALAPAH